jgi:hypothetical protein
MFIENEEANTRLSSLDNLIHKLNLRVKDKDSLEIRKCGKGNGAGRPPGRKNDTDEKRLEIATAAIEVGCVEAAKEHNTTPSRASLLSSGVVTHSKGADEELAPKIQNKKDTIHNQALDLITQAFLQLECQLPEVKKATDLAHIAAEMAKVAERTGGRLKSGEQDNKPQVNVVIYAPRMKSSEEYETIDI